MAGQLWSVNSRGGYMYSDNLSRVLRTALQPACKFRQFCDAKDPAEQGALHKGANFHWNVYSDVETAGAVLVETNTMPETNFTITQGTLTIQEIGNSVPFTGLLDNLSEHPVKEIIHKVLKNDAKKTIDGLAYAQFARTPLRVVPLNGTDTSAVTLTTNGTATSTNAVAMGKEHVKTIVDLMKERNIAPYAGDDYYCIARPSTFRVFKNDLETIKQYTDMGFGHIMSGEIGRYESTRFVEQTNILRGVGSTAGTTWAGAKSDVAFFFGEDTVAEAIAIPEEVRGKLPGDYGRDRGVAWYALLGFGICHTDATQARIVMWDSAA
jgi:N4-gp56 family major capsid protein